MTRRLTKNERKWVASEVFRMRGIYLNYREQEEWDIFLTTKEIGAMPKYGLDKLAKRIVAYYVHPDRTIVP